MILLGVLAIYLIMFEVMPYFRDYRDSWSGLERVGPFKDILIKFEYLFKLALPLGFVPLIFWRNGIMAGPAIGVNLISSVPAMYSAHYHYDDVSGTLLVLSFILSVKEFGREGSIFRLPKNKLIQYAFIVWAILFLVFLPRSGPRYLIRAWPDASHLELETEIKQFDRDFRTQHLVVQDVLGPHFMRRNIQTLAQKPGESCAEDFARVKPAGEVDYILLSLQVSPYQIDDLPQCIHQLETSSRFQRVQGYKHLIIFKQNQN